VTELDGRPLDALKMQTLAGLTASKPQSARDRLNAAAALLRKQRSD
jgi:hypothetical protein